MSLPIPPQGPPQAAGPQGPPPLLESADVLLPDETLEIGRPLPPQPKRKQPSLAVVSNRVERAVSYWSDRDNRMDEDRQLYQLATQNSGAEDFARVGGEVVVRNTPYVTVEKLSNMIGSERPVFSVRAPSPDRTDDAELVEELVRWMWQVWARDWRRTVRGGLQREMAHFACLRGWVAARLRFNPDAGPGELPVELILVDPRNVYPIPGYRGLRYVVHKQRMTYAEAVEEWPEAEQVLGERDDDDTVELEAYYDDWWHAVLIDGKAVKEPTAHGYGVIPWVIAVAGGSPIRSTADDDTSWVAEVGPSVFHGVRQSYRQMNRMLSQLATEVARMGNPATLYYYDPDENDEPQPIDLAPGSTNYLIAPKEKVDVIRTSPSPADVSVLVQALNDDLQRGSLPSVLWGMVGQESSGFAVSVMSGAARDAAAGVVGAMEQVLEDASSMALQLIERFGDQPIGVAVMDRSGRWVSGHAVSPDLIRQVGTDVRVRFRDVSPRDQLAMSQLAAQLSQSKLISLRTAREQYLGLENPDLENEQVLEELIFQDSDLVRNYLTPIALARYDPDLFEAWLAREGRRVRREAEAQAAAPSGGPPMPGMPPTPAPAPLGPIEQIMQAAAASAGAAGVPAPGAGMPQGR